MAGRDPGIGSYGSAGGLIGAELGARRLAPKHLRKVLALVLAVAGVKMIATA